MEPTEKSEEIDNFLSLFYGVDRNETIRQNKCVSCGQDVNPDTFKDSKSRFEYRLSGLCEVCQNEVFGVDTCDGEALNVDENGNHCDGHCDGCPKFDPKE